MSSFSENKWSHISVLSANIIYGINYAIAKGMMPEFFHPRAIIFIRALGAFLLFLLYHTLFVKEKMQRKDVGLFFLCAFFGIAVNQIMFFEGLNLTTSINSAIIMTINPVLVLLFSALILKENITWLKMTGIFIAATGAVVLIGQKGEISFSSETFTGNILIFINAASFALYLVLVKPLMLKYHPVTVMKWVFLLGFFIVFPFTFGSFIETNFSIIPFHIWMSLLYVVVMATFFGYLLYNLALIKLSPSATSSYIYLQPVFAGIVSFYMLKEIPGYVDFIAVALIFFGVYFVNRASQRSN
ncbi:MAG: EamA/RhaT family transporter [Bacteroidetes bacterium HGW-Bacteroidetes-21]|jgi:drug/metabolite transporter (DMT)-like permease|nr:MAG: EamA/RhaT family transporter [Bacteroidetes bacterium HGW-Bacteroidetes-21]